MKILGLTGGSGTGKSAASTAFASLGCAVIDADASYRMLCDTCTPMLEEIQSVFLDVLSSDGKLDRKKLGGKVTAFLSSRGDSNPRPTHYECVALPTEPRKRSVKNAAANLYATADDLSGNRTRVYAVRGRRLDRLTNRP